MSDRRDLIRNAVVFLVDPKTQSSSIAQRIQFLEAKGLTSSEIDLALKEAATNQTGALQYQNHYAPAYGLAPYIAPPPHQWDWRDYFITGVISGTVAYGAVTLFKKYLLPHLQPPNSTAYEEDRDALTAQFDAAEALLKEIQAETSAVRIAVEEQKEKVDKTTKDVEAVVHEMREGETKTRDELREIRDEVNNIREMLPKMIERTKESQNQPLAELQQELKSLKALLLSRGSGLSGSPASPLPLLHARPSIPAWQLAGANQNSGNDMSSSVVPSPVPPVPVLGPSITSNGKGKEVEVTELNHGPS